MWVAFCIYETAFSVDSKISNLTCTEKIIQDFFLTSVLSCLIATYLNQEFWKVSKRNAVQILLFRYKSRLIVPRFLAAV